MMMRSNLLAVLAAQRPPEMPNLGMGSDWKFETRALAAEFRHFTVDALASEVPTISIFDRIGDDGEGGGVTTKRISAALRAIGDKPIRVEINSPGGNYFEGVAIYNQLRRHSREVTIQVLGVAASAASVIAMAGDRIEIAHNAEIMIHEARGLFLGTKSEMKAACSVLEHLDTAMCETYAARSGRDVAEFEAMIAGKDVFFRGDEAIEAGLADALIEREAQMPVYAEGDDFPSDKGSLDAFLAKQGMPRTERRDLYRAITPDTPRAERDNPTPNAGPTEEQITRLLSAMS